MILHMIDVILLVHSFYVVMDLVILIFSFELALVLAGGPASNGARVQNSQSDGESNNATVSPTFACFCNHSQVCVSHLL